MGIRRAGREYEEMHGSNMPSVPVTQRIPDPHEHEHMPPSTDFEMASVSVVPDGKLNWILNHRNFN